MTRKKQMFQATPLTEWLARMLRERNLSAREGSLGAGLDHAAIARYLAGTIPTTGSCSKLAAFFGAPEEYVLELAGHKTREVAGDDLLVQQVRRMSKHWTEPQKHLAIELLQTVDKQPIADPQLG